MKVLIFGKPGSIWVKTVVEHTLIKYGDEVAILSTLEDENNPFLDFYKKNNVKIFPYKKHKGKLGTLISGFTNKDVIKDHYDLFCVHYLNNSAYCVIPVAKHYCKRVLLFCWGSDLLREGKRSFMSSNAFRLADHIGISTNDMLVKFHSLHGHSYDHKIVRTCYGVNGLDIIRDIKTNNKSIRSKYNIDPEKVVITIGYSNSPEQQHLKVLDQIMSLSDEDKSRIHLILRVTYGSGTDEYITQVKNLAEKTGCSYSVFESFLTDMEIAELTSVTDIFIHAQTTDARSASMQEFLFANCLVINPKWISYSDFEDRVFYLKFENFEELKTLVSDNLVLKGNSRYIDKLMKNSEVVADLSLWEHLEPVWRKAYTE